jgi:Bacterial cell division membrane protein
VRHLILLTTAGSVLVGTMLFKLRSGSGYQSARFTAAYDPFSVANSTGHQLINSNIAIVSGGLTGKGLGQGIEKTGFLPEPHTDFIISIISEESGLICVFLSFSRLPIWFSKDL